VAAAFSDSQAALDSTPAARARDVLDDLGLSDDGLGRGELVQDGWFEDMGVEPPIVASRGRVTPSLEE
jgi:hypothetical protein